MVPSIIFRVNSSMELLSPNTLTLTRIFFVPPILYLLTSKQIVPATFLLIFAIFSDFFDGIWARKKNRITELGTLLDPIADKIFILSMCFYLYSIHVLPLIFTILVYFRNIAQLLSIPILKMYLKINFKVKPAPIAKWATAILYFIIFLSIIQNNFIHNFSQLVLYIFIIISSFLEFYILKGYLPRFWLIATKKHDTFE